MKKTLILILLILIIPIIIYTQEETPCPKGMIQIPAGEFNMITPESCPYEIFEEGKQQIYNYTKKETKSYCIDKYEYPNKKGIQPKANINWNESKQICEEQGKRLCTSEEWQKACQGPENLFYPYGNNLKIGKCGLVSMHTIEPEIRRIGKTEECISGYGVHDLSNNLNEWVSDETENGEKVSKGAINTLACSATHSHPKGERLYDDGFRCCKEI